MMTLHVPYMYFGVILLKLTVYTRTLITVGYWLVSGTAVSEMGMFAMWSHLGSICCFVSFIFFYWGNLTKMLKCTMRFPRKEKQRQQRIFIAGRVYACCSKSFEPSGEVELEVQTSRLTEHPWNCKAVKANTADCMTLWGGWHNRSIISDFCRDAYKICTLLGYYTVSSFNPLPTFRTTYQSHLQGSRSPRRILGLRRWDWYVVPKRR
jgi:hypothetical protein